MEGAYRGVERGQQTRSSLNSRSVFRPPSVLRNLETCRGRVVRELLSHYNNGSCTPTLRTIPLAQKPGKMPPSHYALEGARPWSRIFFTTNSPYAFSCGSSSCCMSLGPLQVCLPHPCQRSPSARVPPSPKRSRA